MQVASANAGTTSPLPSLSPQSDHHTTVSRPALHCGHTASFSSTSTEQKDDAVRDDRASTSSLGAASSSLGTSSPSATPGLVKEQPRPQRKELTAPTATPTRPSEYSNLILLPNGTYGPRSPILLNPLKKQGILDQWRTEFGNVGPALTVLRIPAVPTQKEREKEQEEQRAREALVRERERELERDRAREREKEAEEKVWGIPKKAFYLGLGDINFNSQMAMLGGWGSGTGPATDFRSTQNLQRRASSRPTSKDGRPMSKDGRSKEKREREKDKEKKEREGERERESERLERERKEKEQQRAKEEEEAKPMDPEELAALNAIINTRRSMAAAQALASGQVRPTPTRRSMSYGRNGSVSSGLGASGQAARPNLANTRGASQESVPSVSSMQGAGSNIERGTERSLDVFGEEDDGPRIRFAPLPFPDGSLIDGDTTFEGGSGPISIEGRNATSLVEGDAVSMSDDDSESEGSEDDEGWNRRWSGGKGKWYLMGMPSSVFKPQNYRASLKRMSTGPVSNANDTLEGDLSSTETGERRLSVPGALSSSPADTAERRGRRKQRPRGRTSSRASSVKSRSSSVGSMEEEDRLRRRELIRAARPGGTGMVTLPDGTRIKARRVDQQVAQGDTSASGLNTDEPQDEFIEWGFAGLAREAQREHRREGVPEAEPGEDADVDDSISRASAAGEKRASDDESGRLSDVDDGSGMAWVKRRRREREESRASTVGSSRRDEERQQEPQEQQQQQQQQQQQSSTREENELEKAIAEDKTSAPTSVPVLSVSSADEEGEQMLAEAKKPSSDVHSTARRPSPPPIPASRTDKATVAPRAEAPVRSQTLDRISTMPKLSAQQAEEVRRRHEQEVAALGAEVLDHIAKQKAKAAQQQQQQQQQQAPSRPEEQEQQASTKQPPSSSQQNKHQLQEQQQQHQQQQQVVALGEVNLPSEAGTDNAQRDATERQNAERKLPSRKDSAFAKLRRGSYSSNQSNETHTKSSRMASRTMSKDSSDDKDTTPKRVVTPTRPTSASSSLRNLSLSRVNQPNSTSLTGLTTTAEPEGMEELLNTTDAAEGQLAASQKHSKFESEKPEQKEQREPMLQPTQSPVDGKGAASLARTPSIATTSTELSDTISSSLEEHPTSTSMLSTSPSAHLSPSSETHPLSRMRKSTSATRLSSPSDNRLFANPSISLPVPSRLLPRRPDARGYAVVPLPGEQLGIRPERPREGRVWLFDSDEDSDLDSSSEEEEEDDATADGTPTKRKEARANAKGQDPDDDEEDDDDMDAEELAEEERRTAMQKKRATTRAAGAELVSTMGKQGKDPRQSPRTRSRSYGPASGSRSEVFDDVEFISPSRDAVNRRSRRRDSHGHRHYDEAPMSSVSQSRSGHQSQGTKERNLLRSSKAQLKQLRTATSTGALERRGSRKDPWNDFSDNDDGLGQAAKNSGGGSNGKEGMEPSYDDDSELWPPTLSQTLDRGSVKRVSHAAALRHATKARLSRKKRLEEEKEKERERIRRLKENDEFLDYGWPRSLQGSSLY